MDSSRVINFIENSFLKDLLNKSSITDISYNGEFIFYQDNKLGRMKSNLEVNTKDAYDFIRQIANLSDSQFSYTDPILDISVGRYRISATHYAISRKHREKTINFSIRVGYEELRIKENSEFINERCLKLIDLYIKNHESIVIGGLTSSGKTELQKFLISRFKEATRVIVIDNVDELETDYINPSIDIQTWLNLEKYNKINFDSLVKTALRNNPDYLIVSEARGEEMLSILNSSMTGHPTISTIHAKDIFSMPQRMTRMCMLKNTNLKFDETLIDIYDHFKLLIHVKKEVLPTGEIKRYIDSIATNRFEKVQILYKYPNKFYKLPRCVKYDLGLSEEEYTALKKGFEGALDD